ncbi:MAG: signal peptide peptidase SppA [Chlorobium sp.]|nr:MAG: signal peptide peptidase SppA [Chlorobium sp.]
MNNQSGQKKGKGCFRPGCIALVIIPLLLIAVLFICFRSSRSLPDRFALLVPLGGTIDEIRRESGLPPFIASREPLSLQDILFILDHASGDKRVSEVLLTIGELKTTPAKITELRQAIEKVRSRGKKVTAFLHSAGDSDYLLASACDSVVIERGGFLLLDGLKAETLFYAGTLGKIGVGFQAAQWKKYKSGIEPFVRTGPSREYLEEVNSLLSEVYDDYLAYASRRRGISRDSLASIIDRVALMTSEKAKSYGLVDGISSLWQLQRTMTRKITGKEGAQIEDAFVGADRYRLAFSEAMKPDIHESIAVITIAGTIVRSAGEMMEDFGQSVDVQTVKNSVEAALDEKSVKAIVLRIDSPGGDALASAEMLEMLDSAAARKPLVVSMSGVAASGGYMAALAGKTIYAAPLTITGSIGVFALKPDISALAKNIGLERDVVTRGRFADANTPFKPLEGEALDKFIAASGDIYQDFLRKVAASRKITVAEVDSVAGGRVWTGSQAIKARLVDRSGGLFDAIKAAQALAGIEKSKTPRLLFYPEEKNWLENLLKPGKGGLSARLSASLRKQILRDLVPESHVTSLKAFYRMLVKKGGVQVLAVMPQEIVVY